MDYYLKSNDTSGNKFEGVVPWVVFYLHENNISSRKCTVFLFVNKCLDVLYVRDMIKAIIDI